VVAEVADGVDIEITPDPLSVQVPIIVEVLDALGLVIVGADGYEADDVIATLAARSTMPVDIVTGDRDLFQLVDDSRDVRVLYTARGVGRLEVLSEKEIVSRYGVLPEQYAAYATLRGDTSDGLPGVSGIGAKTASSLLAQYGDLEGVLAAAAEPGSRMASALRAKLSAAADYLAVAPTVVAVATSVDLPERSYALPDEAPLDRSRYDELVERWGLGGSAERAVAALNARR
jgi:5'-3' exonuclease